MTEELTSKEERKINSYKDCIKGDEEGGSFFHAAINYERIAKIYKNLGESQKAKEALKQAMLDYEKDTSFNNALRLAIKLNEKKREVIYRKLDSLKVFDDYDKETQELFKELEKFN